MAFRSSKPLIVAVVGSLFNGDSQLPSQRKTISSFSLDSIRDSTHLARIVIFYQVSLDEVLRLVKNSL
jgi:hypothetical protein